MPESSFRKCFRACALIGSMVLVPLASADTVEPIPTVLPDDGVFALPDTCIVPVCLGNIGLSNFNDTNFSLSGGNELATSDVSLTADAFNNVSGMPGMFIAPVTLNGQIDITYFSKGALSEPGTFNDQITFLDLTGTLNGHSIEAMLNPMQPSTGQTTVTPIGGTPPQFKVNSSFDVFAELSIDNGPFIPGPERVANLTATPEPAYYGATGILLAGLIALRVVRSKRSARA
jgi:hypothetical protein